MYGSQSYPEHSSSADSACVPPALSHPGTSLPRLRRLRSCLFILRSPTRQVKNSASPRCSFAPFLLTSPPSTSRCAIPGDVTILAARHYSSSGGPMSTDAPAAPLPGAAPSTRLVRHKKATLRNLTILVIAGEFVALAGYFFWHKDNPELAKAFGEAAAALLFGSMLGAVVQVLFNDLELTRVIRAARAEFISNVLADLKSVHDRVERARSLILAHQSAKTYGEEIRDLIEYRVKLHNVARAIQFDPRGEVLRNISENVQTIRSYLDVVVKEFESSYKEISRKQSQYESEMKAA